MITQEEFKIHEKIAAQIYEIADTWHQHAFKSGGGYGTSKPRLQYVNRGGKHVTDIVFYRKMYTSGIGYYNPEQVTIENGSKYLFNGSTLIEDAKQHLTNKIKREEERVKTVEEKIQALKRDSSVQEFIRLTEKENNSNNLFPPFYGRIDESIS